MNFIHEFIIKETYDDTFKLIGVYYEKRKLWFKKKCLFLIGEFDCRGDAIREMERISTKQHRENNSIKNYWIYNSRAEREPETWV